MKAARKPVSVPLPGTETDFPAGKRTMETVHAHSSLIFENLPASETRDALCLPSNAWQKRTRLMIPLRHHGFRFFGIYNPTPKMNKKLFRTRKKRGNSRLIRSRIAT